MNAFNILEVTLKDITNPEHFVNKDMRQNSSQTLVVRVIDHSLDSGKDIVRNDEIFSDAALFTQNEGSVWDIVKEVDPIEWSVNDNIVAPRNVTKIILSVA